MPNAEYEKWKAAWDRQYLRLAEEEAKKKAEEKKRES